METLVVNLYKTPFNFAADFNKVGCFVVDGVRILTVHNPGVRSDFSHDYKMWGRFQETLYQKASTTDGFKNIELISELRDKLAYSNYLETIGAFKGNKHVLNLPLVTLNLDNDGSSFGETKNNLDLKIKEDPILGNEKNYLGLDGYILRPSNGTRSVKVFRIIKPDLFRKSLFKYVISQIEGLKKISDDDLDTVKTTVRSEMQNLGIFPISANTLDKAQINKYCSESFSWILTPFIHGNDVRIVKIGEAFFVHLWEKCFEDTSRFENVKVDDIVEISKTKTESLETDLKLVPKLQRIEDKYSPEVCAEIRKLMDNNITPHFGVVDFRESAIVDEYIQDDEESHVVHKLYFLETSFNFMIECYRDEDMKMFMVEYYRYIIKLNKVEF